MTTLKRCRYLPILGLISLFAGAASAQQVDWKKELGTYSGNTLRIIMIQDPWVGAFDTIDKEFEALTGAKVTVDAFGYDQTHEKEVLVGTSGSDEFDVIVLDSPWVGEFAQGGFVEDLGPYVAKDAKIVQFADFVPSFQTVSNWKGATVGVPFGAYFVMTHYRKDVFAQAGLSAPKTIADFEKAAKTLTKNPKFPGLYGTALNNQRGAPVGQAYFEYIFNFGGKPFASLYPGSPDPYADMTPMLTSKESIAVVKYFKEMLKYEPPGALNFAWDERATTFSVGKTAMINAWSVRTPGFMDPSKSRIADKFATTLYPAKAGVKAVPPLGGWVMGINKASKKKALAWDYIKWFTSQEIHKKFVLAGGPPSRLSTLQDAEVRSKQPWASTLFESQAASFADCRPRIPESFQIIDTIGLYISKALNNQLSVEDAMKQANAELKTLLKKKGYMIHE
jgi:multiple sugar transport system substrate-binding protein